ncbi:YisL family protein [Radiobacillus kanasensis]|uniref:YisL family protein n=1 Tax=Radiobacillus kanasensis TaxID=2844358 RepID=UPI001E41603F|nr:YisL family protein [Radiobacillus kanasensis]UFU00532.1 YisL family protein [Radiobacillus kanasensis]
MNTHLHITSWVLAIILLLVALSFYKKDNQKVGKILHMILRLDYLLILYSGGALLTGYFQTGEMLPEVITKVLAGIWVIAAVEMVLTKTAKNKPVRGTWIQFAIALVLVLALGFGRLPLGLLP